jgi:hypothetical protein
MAAWPELSARGFFLPTIETSRIRQGYAQLAPVFLRLKMLLPKLAIRSVEVLEVKLVLKLFKCSVGECSAPICEPGRPTRNGSGHNTVE